MKRVSMFFVEGNIGVGKSTLVKELEGRGLATLQEPVAAWESVVNQNGKNVLQEFYDDPKKWAYAFQSIAFRSRIIGMKDLPTGCIVERSVYTDRMVFAETAHEAGNISPIEWDDYTGWFDFVMNMCNVSPMGIIYLRGSPTTCMNQIKTRGRPGEENITLDYLKQLHAKHDKWLLEEPNVLVLDIDKMDRATFADRIIDFVSRES